MTGSAASIFAMASTPEGGSDFLSALKVGDKVITTGGLHGQIVKLNEKSVQLQVADKVRVEVARAAIGGYQGQEPVVEPSNQ
jgi:preprotein translocase subunit YajC